MNKVYYLKTCSTCIRIINALNLSNNFIFQDIKTEPITAKQLDEMKNLAGSYQALFSKRAKLYKEMNLKNHDLKEADFKHYLLNHYTFLSRPVFIINNAIYIGNSKSNIEAVKKALNV